MANYVAGSNDARLPQPINETNQIFLYFLYFMFTFSTILKRLGQLEIPSAVKIPSKFLVCCHIYIVSGTGMPGMEEQIPQPG